MVKVQGMSEEGKRELRKVGMKMIHRKSGDYVQLAKVIKSKTRRRS